MIEWLRPSDMVIVRRAGCGEWDGLEYIISGRDAKMCC